MATRSKFTPETQQRLVSAVQSGILLASAAKWVGISRVTLHNWLGSRHKKYREFQAEMLQAQGYAAARAEMDVYKADPKFWLLCGPAREKYNPDGTVAEEGWAKPSMRPLVRVKKPCECCGHVEGQPRAARAYLPGSNGRRHPAAPADTKPPYQFTAEDRAELREAFYGRMEYHAPACRAAGQPITNPVTEVFGPTTGYEEGDAYLAKLWAEWVANNPHENIEGHPRTAAANPAQPASNQPSAAAATQLGGGDANEVNKVEGVKIVKNDAATARGRGNAAVVATGSNQAEGVKIDGAGQNHDRMRRGMAAGGRADAGALANQADQAEGAPDVRNYVAYLRSCQRSVNSAATTRPRV